ncbi:MAG: 3-methyl-2-oxobutanoate hydroxymethyltransferase [Candidatus Delongbacteria bacterium]|nr:3-methyl-2-oxobutanoate hydroxymethyltransferase [Candidatus Delongbacteria bacterium]MBN2836195.1 3-methyl-2-oxobutanoate hydroxymethyltransferase [Candidatus Delongbacteria bacterium]
MVKRNTITDIQKKYCSGEKLAVLTAYDHSVARLVDSAGIDMILVGDSLGMVVQGHNSTIPVELDHIMYHTEIVVRSTEKAFIIADMPFMSYQISHEEAIRNALTIIKKTGCNAVKIEGAGFNIPIIERLTEVGIPVMGHLGLQPQSVNILGGYPVQGREKAEAMKMIEDARKLEKAGVFSIVLEKVSSDLTAEITSMLNIPTIGIGSGSDCSGQVLVVNDMLGMDEYIKFKFVRKYADLSNVITNAVKEYISDVKEMKFPAQGESF